MDEPTLKINKNESTEMPFRYVKGENGESIMPEVCFVEEVDLLRGPMLIITGYDGAHQEGFGERIWRFVLKTEWSFLHYKSRQQVISRWPRLENQGVSTRQ